jgi:hypothetical protein
MNMKRVVVIVGLMVLSSTAGATCTKLEFAELDSMSKDELVKMRCKYEKESDAPHHPEAGLAVHTRELDALIYCNEQIQRMNRILLRKYFPGEEGRKQLGATCRVS